jgi:hypothetical protein
MAEKQPQHAALDRPRSARPGRGTQISQVERLGRLAVMHRVGSDLAHAR